MPDIPIEFSKYDIIAAIIPGSLVLVGLLTFIPADVFTTLQSYFAVDNVMLFVVVLAATIGIFVIGKIISQSSFRLIERFANKNRYVHFINYT